MNEHLIEAAASKHSSIDDYGQIVFPEGEWDKFVAALSTPQADKVPAAEGASEPDWRMRHKMDDLLDAYEAESKCVTYNGWWRKRDPKDIRKELDCLVEGLTQSTPPTKLPQEAQPVKATPYNPTEEMRHAAKAIDPALTHEQIRALWAVMWSASPQPARADDEYQMGYADGAGIYRANAVKAIKEYQPAHAGAVEPARYLPTYGSVSWEWLKWAVADAKGSTAEWEDSFIGHQVVRMNMNSLNRIVSAAATTAATGARPMTRGEHEVIRQAMWDSVEVVHPGKAATGGKEE